MPDRPSNERLVWAVRIAGLVLGVIAIVVGLLAIRDWISQEAWPRVVRLFQQLQALYVGLADPRSQLAVIALLLAFGLGVALIVVLGMLRASHERVGQAETARDNAQEEAAETLADIVAEMEEAVRGAELDATKLARLEQFRRATMALEISTISEMVRRQADSAGKRTESVNWILFFACDILKLTVPGFRDSFIECLRDGLPPLPRAIPFPLPWPADLQDVQRPKYKLHVLKSYTLTDEEIDDIENLPNDKGLVNQAISTGKAVYLPNIDSPQADGVYWRPDHEVGYRSMICVPAQATKKVVGVLCADSTVVNAFGELERELLGHFARNIALLYAALPTDRLWD